MMPLPAPNCPVLPAGEFNGMISLVAILKISQQLYPFA